MSVDLAPVLVGLVSIVAVVLLIWVLVAIRRGADCGRPGLHNFFVRRPAVVLDRLDRLEARGVLQRAPNLWQIALGTFYMRYRILFRPDTIGVGPGARRRTPRARWLDLRPIRAPFLLWERVIAPFELTGLSLDVSFLHRHLLGAYHPLDHGMYDLELMSLHDGALQRLREAAVEVASGQTPRARWLQDLCVYEGYHARLVGLVDRAMRGEFEAEGQAITSDTTLAGFMRWCAKQPDTPGKTLRAWRAGTFSLDPRVVDTNGRAILEP